MFGTALFVSALAIVVATGLVARITMCGTTGHLVEARGRLIGG